MKTFAVFIKALLLVFCSYTTAHAISGFRVSPLKINLSAIGKDGQLELTNLSNQDITIQVKLFEWQQESGRDVYLPTRDILFAPPIFNVPKGRQKTIRFRLKRGADKTQELSYRVYVEQLRQGGLFAPTSGTEFRLKIGVPLFVAPIKPSQPEFNVNANYLSDGSIRLSVDNYGKKHLKIYSVELYQDGKINREDVFNLAPNASLAKKTNSDAGTNYVLPGSEQRWSLPANNIIVGQLYWLLLRTDFYNVGRESNVTPEGFLWVPVTSSNGTDEKTAP